MILIDAGSSSPIPSDHSAVEKVKRPQVCRHLVFGGRHRRTRIPFTLDRLRLQQGSIELHSEPITFLLDMLINCSRQTRQIHREHPELIAFPIEPGSVQT